MNELQLYKLLAPPGFVAVALARSWEEAEAIMAAHAARIGVHFDVYRSGIRTVLPIDEPSSVCMAEFIG